MDGGGGRSSWGRREVELLQCASSLALQPHQKEDEKLGKDRTTGHAGGALAAYRIAWKAHNRAHPLSRADEMIRALAWSSRRQALPPIRFCSYSCCLSPDESTCPRHVVRAWNALECPGAVAWQNGSCRACLAHRIRMRTSIDSARISLRS